MLARDLVEHGGRGPSDHREALAAGELVLHREQLVAAALALQPGVVQALQDAEDDQRGGTGRYPCREARALQAHQQEVDHQHLQGGGGGQHVPAERAERRRQRNVGAIRPGMGRSTSHRATALSVSTTTSSSDGSSAE